MDIRIETLAPFDCLARMGRGPYPESAPAAWAELSAYVGKAGLMPHAAIGFGLDPICGTPPGMLRYLACVAVEEAQIPETLPAHIHRRHVPGGRYAIHRMIGPYQRMPQLFKAMHEEWYPQSGELLDFMRPFLEIYVNDPGSVPPEEYITDLCLPLRERPDEPVDELIGA